MIDSTWFYRQLEHEGRSLRDLARALNLDPSAVSRMLRGERRMSADEQDRIADYFGVSLLEVAARRRGEGGGFAEQGQEPLRMDEAKGTAPKDGSGTESFLARIRGRMAGTVTVAPGVDLTAPADPEWARVYDDDYPVSL